MNTVGTLPALKARVLNFGLHVIKVSPKPVPKIQRFSRLGRATPEPLDSSQIHAAKRVVPSPTRS
jgi:hypothetical protein